MSGEAHSKRLGKLREAMERSGLACVVVAPGPNMRYLTGVSSLLLERPFFMIVTGEGEPQMVAPELEAGPYRRSPLRIEVHSWTDSEGPSKAIAKAAKGAGSKGRWGVEGRMPFLFLDRLMKAADPQLVDAEPVLQGVREVKDESEVRLLKEAGKVLSRAFDEFPGLIKEGATEAEVARAATDKIYDKGGTRVDDMLVQSGPRAADPHSLASSKRIRRGEGVIFDVGATFEGYYADVTRTIPCGSAKGLERVYSKVLEAEEKGIAASKAGVQVGKVDGASRGALKEAGLAKYFIHRTGHGLGLEVHEAPYIVEGGTEKFIEAMCFTVEPGVYIPGKLGVRIEDDVLIEGGKGKVLTDTPKEFGWWR